MKSLIVLLLLPFCFSVIAEENTYEKLERLDDKQKDHATSALSGLAATTVTGVVSNRLYLKDHRLTMKNTAEVKRVHENIKIKNSNGLSTKSANRYMTVLNDKQTTRKQKNKLVKFAKGNLVLAGAGLMYFGANTVKTISIRNQMAEIINCNPLMLDTTNENDEVAEDLADLIEPVTMLEESRDPATDK
jgi:hypothetical protein